MNFDHFILAAFILLAPDGVGSQTLDFDDCENAIESIFDNAQLNQAEEELLDACIDDDVCDHSDYGSTFNQICEQQLQGFVHFLSSNLDCEDSSSSYCYLNWPSCNPINCGLEFLYEEDTVVSSTSSVGGNTCTLTLVSGMERQGKDFCQGGFSVPDAGPTGPTGPTGSRPTFPSPTTTGSRPPIGAIVPAPSPGTPLTASPDGTIGAGFFITSGVFQQTTSSSVLILLVMLTSWRFM